MAGTIQIKSSCSLIISTSHNGDKWETYYSHMRIDNHIKNGSHVDQGERIGKIETNSFAANCNMNCDKRDQFEIASGPHLHMELFKNEERESLNDKEFSGFIIKAGIYNMDLYGHLEDHCNYPKDCSKAYRNDKYNSTEYCATRFIDKRNRSIMYCPSVIGANFGKLCTNLK